MDFFFFLGVYDFVSGRILFVNGEGRYLILVSGRVEIQGLYYYIYQGGGGGSRNLFMENVRMFYFNDLFVF